MQTEFHGFVGVPVVAVHICAEDEEIDVVSELVIEPTISQMLALQTLKRGIDEIATLAAAADGRSTWNRRTDFLNLVDRGWRIGRRVLQEDQVALIVGLRRTRSAAADDAAEETRLVKARIADNDIRRCLRAQTLNRPVVPAKLTSRLIKYTGSIIIFIAAHDVATATEQIGTASDAQAIVLTVVELRNTEAGVHLKTCVIAIGNEVNYASHGVRAVNCRHTAGYHIDPL